MTFTLTLNQLLVGAWLASILLILILAAVSIWRTVSIFLRMRTRVSHYRQRLDKSVERTRQAAADAETIRLNLLTPTPPACEPAVPSLAGSVAQLREALHLLKRDGLRQQPKRRSRTRRDAVLRFPSR